MPKQLVSQPWLETPCKFRQLQKSSQKCTLCDSPFTFFNSPRLCGFCGHVFHRVDCSVKVRLGGGLFRRRRICKNCETYRHSSGKLLKTGGEFVCTLGGGGSCAVNLSVSEETAELVLDWKSHSVKETVDLLRVESHTGFSTAGRMRSVDYDPLRSLSLKLTDAVGERVVDLQAPTAWECRLWVDGLKVARYVYHKLLQQEIAMEIYHKKGVKVSDSIFKINYLPADIPIPSPYRMVASSFPPTRRVARSTSPWQNYTSCSSPTRGVARRKLTVTIPRQSSTSTCSEPGWHSDDDFSERSTTPANIHSGYFSCAEGSLSPVYSMYRQTRRYSHRPKYDIVNSVRSQRALSPQFKSSSPTAGLPYRQSPLSSVCSCHDYEIAPSRSVLIGGAIEKDAPASNQPRCCSLCKVACRIAVDLDNL